MDWSSYGPGTGLNVMCLFLHYQINQVFTVLGTPKIFFSDNGQELDHIKEWPGEVMIVSGQPRNPKCQVLLSKGMARLGVVSMHM